VCAVNGLLKALFCGGVVAAVVMCSVSSGESGGVTCSGLRCEYRVNPLGVDTVAPRLSWLLHSDERGQKQSGYRILVAGSEDALRADKGDLWDSGRVRSGDSVGVPYQGKALRSAQRCYWKVRVWDKDGRPSDWSRTAWWEMGLLEEKDWQGRWIDDGKTLPEKDEDFYRDDPAPLFRREFTTTGRIESARLYICGLGYYEASLNGKRAIMRPLSTAKRSATTCWIRSGRIIRTGRCTVFMMSPGFLLPAATASV